MLPVSAEWRNAVQQQFRYPGYLKMNMEIVPPGLREGETVTISQGDADSADPSVLGYRADNAPPFNITLEKNRWLLDGTFKPIESIRDWWSQKVVTYPIVMNFIFDGTYDIPGIYFEWDLVGNSWPTAITVYYYGASDNLLRTYVVNPVTSVKGFVDIPCDAVKSVIINIEGWGIPDWRARVNAVVFGLYVNYDSINNGRIMHGEFLDAASPLNESLPTHTFKVQLRNEDQALDPALQTGFSKYLARRQRVQFQWGFTTSYGNVEWAPMMTFYLNQFRVPSSSQVVDLDTTSRLALLTRVFKKDDYTGEPRSFLAIANNILLNSDVIRDAGDSNPWSLIDRVGNYSTTAPVPRRAANVCLQLIAEATASWLTTEAETGRILMTDFDSDVAQASIDKLQQQGDPEIKVQDQLYLISVGVYKYTAKEETSEIAQGEYLVNGTVTLQIDYNPVAALNVQCTVEDATLVSFTPYGTSAIVVVSSETETVAKIVLTGNEVVSSVSYVDTYRDQTITHGLEVVIDNPMVTDAEVAQLMSDCVLEWYGKRQTLTADYTGYPELMAGDTVSTNTRYGQNNSMKVLSNKITFNGGFMGVAEVR